MPPKDLPNHIALPASSATPPGTNVTNPTSPSPRTPPPAVANNATGAQATSPTSSRHSFLGFMRTRARSSTLGQQPSTSASLISPTQSQFQRSATPERAGNTRSNAREQTVSGRASGGTNGNGVVTGGGVMNTGAAVTRTVSTPLSGSTIPQATTTSSALAPDASLNTAPTPPGNPSNPLKTYRIRLVPHLESNRSLPFDPVIREMAPIIVTPFPGTTPSDSALRIADPGTLSSAGGGRTTVGGKPVALVLKIGRFTDKSERLPVPTNSAPLCTGGSGIGNINGDGTLGPDGPRTGSATFSAAGGGGEVTSGKAAFRSKVVSRSHAEIWCEEGGKFYIRDTKSSSGTFLNHIRLSSPNTESRPMMLKDGDILQLGVDYQGGTEDMFKCIKMRVEVGREWQRGANEFNTNALKQLKALGGDASVPDSKGKDTHSKKAKASVTDCCICLFSVTVCQSLFIAPCSHVFHYKCIRPLLLQHYPGFSCPLCRTFANLEDDVETEDAWEIASRRASVISRRASNHSILAAGSSTPAAAAEIESNGNFNTGTAVAGNIEVASANELLPPPNVPGEPEGLQAGMPLARQATAVAQVDPITAGPDVTSETIATVPEEREGFVAPSSATIPRPIVQPGSYDPSGNTTLSETATPMNDTFLSTLALAPGMIQRLELADEVSQAGTGSLSGMTGSNGGSNAGSNAGSNVGSRNESRRQSREVEGNGHMYT
ncbi:Cytoplasm protein, putative [Cryptococcus gattii WM276]|uniref:Cytoplasm protein, putative n=1 Tax=Cryptococcus gattii serotype B (strain WM276 / ATCC MYA-4071) TaxID=367775 RepID=E6R9J9_CRYGW|nr:Cytoplasm protein, putative [Cryptococcus gattii WM276]ADV23570.1 Cytoplasm protein, putative [Cryptococcus gattii WM276]